MWVGGGSALTGSGLSLVGRLLGSREVAGYVWAAMIVWGEPVLATTVLLLVGRLWGRQGAVNIGMAAGAALGAWQWEVYSITGSWTSPCLASTHNIPGQQRILTQKYPDLFLSVCLSVF